MAIRFRCQHCNQLLGIATRKAGSEIRCPKCGIPQIVPSEEAAAAAMAMSRFAKTPILGENHSELMICDDKPRRGYYVQGLLLLVLAAVAFGAGYFVGRGDATLRKQIEQEELAKQRVLIEGKLVYDLGTGRIAGDNNAVVIALPEGKLPGTTLSIWGIRPQDLPPSDTQKSVRMIREFGGAYARANAEGDFSMVVPQQGKYRLLLISNHATRPKGVEIDEIDLVEMGKYFTLADHLINHFKYRWMLKEIDIGTEEIGENFGRDAKE